ncbi:molybdate ABC transporter substrate-binding protein [Methylocella sp.]|uniref:molybdate ABC transporter substrate-binding protein n=1 Tax=Methylocella sp. TaxID=1978226 RepID=UPI003784888D
MRHFSRRAALCLAGLAAVAAWSDEAAAQWRRRAQPKLHVLAAASMQTALDAVARSWTAGGRPRPVIIYASSAVHARQIEHGAPADVFVSADETWADHLEKAGLLEPGTRRNLVKNDLVLIAPADSKAEIKIEKGFDLAGAIGDGRLAVCTIGSCPGGVYAQEALTSLGVWDKVEPRLAQASNIRGALNLVALGEARFGVVYLTDANAERRVRVVGVFPAWTHSPIVYPVALVKGARRPEAQAFLDYLFSPAAQAAFTREGFTLIAK